MPPLTIRTKDGQVKTVNWEGPNAPTQRDVDEIESALYQQGVFKMRQPAMVATAPPVGRPAPMQGNVGGTLAPSNLGAQLAEQIGLPQNQPVQGPPAPKPIKRLEDDSEYKKWREKKNNILGYLGQPWVQRTLSQYGETPDIKAKRAELARIDDKLKKIAEIFEKNRQIANQGRELGLELAAAKQIIAERGPTDYQKFQRGFNKTLGKAVGGAADLATAFGVAGTIDPLTGQPAHQNIDLAKQYAQKGTQQLGEFNQTVRDVARAANPMAKVPVVGGAISDMGAGLVNPLESAELLGAFSTDPGGTLKAIKDSFDWTKAKTPEQKTAMLLNYGVTAAGLFFGGKGLKANLSRVKNAAEVGAEISLLESQLSKGPQTSKVKQLRKQLGEIKNGIDVALDPSAVKNAKYAEAQRNKAVKAADGKTPPPSPLGLPQDRAPSIVKPEQGYKAGDAPNLVEQAKRRKLLEPKEEVGYEVGEAPNLVKMAGEGSKQPAKTVDESKPVGVPEQESRPSQDATKVERRAWEMRKSDVDSIVLAQDPYKGGSTYEVDWGAGKGQGKRIGQSGVVGSMSDAPKGKRTYRRISEQYANEPDVASFDAYQKEFYAQARNAGLGPDDAWILAADPAQGHMLLVEKGLKEGKPVPPEVLADYPDLAAKYPDLAQPRKAQNEAPPTVKDTLDSEQAGLVASPENIVGSEGKKASSPPIKIPDAPHKAPEFDIPTTSEKPKFQIGEPERVTGVAKQITQRPPQKGTSVEDIARQGREELQKHREGKGGIDPRSVAARTLSDGKPMSDVELSTVGARLREIENERVALESEIRKGIDPVRAKAIQENLDQLNVEGERLLSAADLSLNQGFHRMGMAAQVVYKPDYSLSALQARAKVALLGTEENVPAAINKRLDQLSKQYADAQAELKALRESLAKEIPKSEPKVVNPRTRQQSVDTLKKYFGQQPGSIPKPGVKAGKKSGAVSYTLGSEEMQAMKAVRTLAKDLAQNGAGTLDDVLNGIRKEIGVNIPDETLLRMLSDKYRKYMLESDVARLESERFLKDVQRGAEFRLKTPAKKALAIAGEAFNTTQRTMQAGLDLSAPFIQGRKGLFANPEAWIKAWRPMLEAMIKGDRVALENTANIKAHPMYARAKAAGLDLTEMGGKFTQQEEVFAGNLVNLLKAKMPGGNKNPLNWYLKALDNSNAAYDVFLNRLRFDTFTKLAEAAPNNPAYLRDVANTINVIYGRGGGEIAKRLGGVKAGNVVYAPRYKLSQFQYAFGQPLLKAETALGRGTAFKIYAAQAIAYGSLVGLAKLAGWDVDTDARSTDFGKLQIGKGDQAVKVDLFAKEGQAYRLMMQLAYGKISQSGSYTDPNKYGATNNVLGSFSQSNLAPGLRTIHEGVFGVYEKGEGNRQMTWADFGKKYLPLWVQQASRDGTFWNMKTTAPQFFGLDVSKGEIPKKQVPLDPLKPGVLSKKPKATTAR